MPVRNVVEPLRAIRAGLAATKETLDCDPKANHCKRAAHPAPKAVYRAKTIIVRGEAYGEGRVPSRARRPRTHPGSLEFSGARQDHAQRPGTCPESRG